MFDSREFSRHLMLAVITQGLANGSVLSAFKIAR